MRRMISIHSDGAGMNSANVNYSVNFRRHFTFTYSQFPLMLSAKKSTITK